MNLVDAFLWVTALSYFCALFIPKTATKIWWGGKIRPLPLWAEKVLFFLMELLITLSLTEVVRLWEILCIVYVGAALLCWTGYQDWGSTAHNLSMFAWDLLIAIACLVKAT